jgi:transposase
VLDNLSSHKGSRVKEVIEREVASYSLPPSEVLPELIPIEEALAKVKVLLLREQRGAARKMLIGAIGRSPEALAGSDTRDFFKPRGYRATVRLLCQTL